MKLTFILVLLIARSFQNELVLPMNHCDLNLNLARDCIFIKTEGTDSSNQESKDERAVYEYVKGGLIRRVIFREIEIFNDEEEHDPLFRRLVRHEHYENSDIIVIDSMSDVFRNERAFYFTNGKIYNLMEVENALEESLKHCNRPISDFVRKLVYLRMPKILNLENYNGLGLIRNEFRLMDQRDNFEEHIKFHFNCVLQLIELKIESIQDQ
ncbi:hypothetical protein MACJ_002004 [Theileria orientalis]|uniref:Uncharacterized protein n=1 Tax=Theileria orientalis TaxID=68886 RepID=A0A976QS01_THEOR|nr:hypothetical protein MACJ_002004 [Theileria orientalis]